MWLEQKISQGYLYYYNTENKESCWEKPDDMINNSAVLTREEIQVNIHYLILVLSSVTLLHYLYIMHR